ncbi:MAG: YdcF family protein [Oscillospiraceae bacterium]|nr:YdcF family protein [Oscillospiraceae bacterium]
MNERIISDITDFIFIADEPQKADAILLPGGSDPAIPERAAELYHLGYAPVLIPAGGQSVKTGTFGGVRIKADIYNGDYETDCAFHTDVLLKNGVPLNAIIGEDRSGYTKENALLSRKVADENGLLVRKALIVCKAFHARRSLMCYQLSFPDVEIFVAPVDVYGISRDNWHKQGYGVERVLGELSRCGDQFVNEMKEMSNNE